MNTPPIPSPGGPTPSTTQVPDLRVELKSNPLLLAGVREMVLHAAKRLGFADDVAGHMALAVDEALCNVIRHGYNQVQDRPIWLSLFAESEHPSDNASPFQIRIVIEDEAAQVDPALIKSRDLDEIRPGGLGVHIIKSVMDHVTYEKRQPIGMRLTMIKRRADLTPTSPSLPQPTTNSSEVRHG